MLEHHIIIQIAVIFIWTLSNCKYKMAILLYILVYTAPQYVRYISSLQQTRYDYQIS